MDGQFTVDFKYNKDYLLNYLGDTYMINIEKLIKDFERMELPEDYDPTPWCHTCYAMTKSKCNCGEVADND